VFGRFKLGAGAPTELMHLLETSDVARNPQVTQPFSDSHSHPGPRRTRTKKPHLK